MNRVQNKVVIVTGGSLGIGRAACLLLAKEGARVAVTDIMDAEGRALAEQIQAEGGQAAYWHMDTSKEEEVQQAFLAIAQTFGGIDVLVNNAGIGGANKPTHEITREEWDHVMAINVNGVFYCTKHAIPYMLKAGAGSIINLSSIYGLVGAPDAPPYHASKGAVRLMAKTDAMLYAKNQIRVNSIHPGYIWTPLVENAMKAQGLSAQEAKSALASLHPLGYVGDPDDIAYGIVYLASDESRFVTGSELVIDGGYTAH